MSWLDPSAFALFAAGSRNYRVMTKPPVSIGRYEVVRPIGQGGMGSLYLVWDPRLERQIAIKLLKDDDDELRERFSREARAAARLRHPHIVTIFDVGDHEGQPFIAMEFVQGETLGEIVRHRRPMSIVRKVELIEALCDGLGFAHKAGIVHRDIKPANIMVDAEGALKILDFGIARAVESVGMTQAGMLIGTLNYMSPEQIGGLTIDHRSDIFAVGAVFYELVAYRQAFPGSVLGGVLNKILHESPEPLTNLVRGVHSEIVRIVSRAVEKNQADRYQDLASMRKELLVLRLHLEASESATEVIEMPNAAGRAPDARAPLTPSKPTPTPGRRGADREELARRRAEQIQAQLAHAHAAIGREDFEAAVAACEQGLLLDPDDARALDLLDRARTALEQRQAKDMLASALEDLDRGSLTSARGLVERAAALDPEAAAASGLEASVERAFDERHQERERAQAMARAIATALSHAERGSFDAAEMCVAEVLAIDPSHAEALALRDRIGAARAAIAREALDRRAREAVTAAEGLFAQDQHQAAIGLLARFEPVHDAVSRAADRLRAEAARIEKRRRAEAEARARDERVAAGLARAQEQIDRAEYAAALRELSALRQAEGQSPDLQEAVARAEAGRASVERVARERQQAIAAALKKARRASSNEAALIALNEVLALDPDHAEARSLSAERQRALEKTREEARAREAARERDAVRERERAREREAARARQSAEASSTSAATIVVQRPQGAPTERLPTIPEATLAMPAVAPQAPLVHRVETARLSPPQPPAVSPVVITAKTSTLLAYRNYLGAAGIIAMLAAVGGYFIFGNPAPPASIASHNAPAAAVNTPAQAPPLQASPPATSVPVPPAPLASAPTAAQTPPPGAARPSGVPVDQQLMIIRTLAKRQYDRGDRVAALATAMEGWRLNRDDAGLKLLLQILVQEAESDLLRARSAADTVGPAAMSSPRYSEGRVEQGKASVMARQGDPPDEVIRQYRQAATLFEKAVEDTRKPASPPGAAVASNPTGTAANQPATNPPATGANPPAAAGAAAPPPPASPVDDKAAILATVREYARAFGLLDANAVVRVYQANLATLQRAYGNNARQQLQLPANLEIVVSGTTATARGPVRLTVDPKSGSEVSSSGTAVFRLQKTGNRWMIVRFEMQ
jgi:ketosteroid isomerase-like protein/predicted Ser/Thr protein kinase